MNEDKKFSINNMLLAFITFLGVVGLVALTGFFLLTPPDDIIMGQAEATQVRISGKVPGRIEAYRFGEGDKVKAGDTLVFWIRPKSLPSSSKRRLCGVLPKPRMQRLSRELAHKR